MRLIEIWNSLPGVEPVKRFTSRPVALTRIWKAIQRLKPTADSHRQIESRKKTESSLAGRSSKKAQVISLLRQPAGASLQAIMGVTGWQAHTIRGFISSPGRNPVFLRDGGETDAGGDGAAERSGVEK